MSTTTMTRAEAVDAHGVVLTPEQRAQAVPVLDEHGKPKVDAQGRPVLGPAARAAGPNVLAQKKAQAVMKAEAAVDAAKGGNAAAKEAAAAELRRAHALPDAV